MKPVKDWNCWSDTLLVANSELLVVAHIARECGSSWNYTPVSVLIQIYAGFLYAGESLYL